MNLSFRPYPGYVEPSPTTSYSSNSFTTTSSTSSGSGTNPPTSSSGLDQETINVSATPRDNSSSTGFAIPLLVGDSYQFMLIFLSLFAIFAMRSLKWSKQK